MSCGSTCRDSDGSWESRRSSREDAYAGDEENEIAAGDDMISRHERACRDGGLADGGWSNLAGLRNPSKRPMSQANNSWAAEIWVE